MVRGTALRRDGRIPALMLDPHHRGLAQLAAAYPAVGDDHHGQAGVAQRRALRPARSFVELHLLPDPGPRARLVVILNWHAASQAPGRGRVATGPGSLSRASGHGRGRRQRESMDPPVGGPAGDPMGTHGGQRGDGSMTALALALAEWADSLRPDPADLELADRSL